MGDFQKKEAISGICEEDGYAFSRCMITNPEPDHVNFRDIAKSLSRQPMYQGMTHDFYSVAQHSILISDIIYDHVSRKPEIMLQGLLLFARVAYSGLLSCNLKVHSNADEKFSIHLTEVIHCRIGLPVPHSMDSSMINRAFKIAHQTAKRDLLPENTFGNFGKTAAYKHPITFINEMTVQEIYLKRLADLITQSALILPSELEQMV